MKVLGNHTESKELYKSTQTLVDTNSGPVVHVDGEGDL